MTLRTAPTTRRVKDLLADRAHEMFVGRSGELRAMAAMLDGGPRVLFVHGVAGIGKSTLLSAFSESARSQGVPMVNLDCRVIEPTERGLLHELSVICGTSPSHEAVAEQLAALGPRVLLTLDNYEVFRLMDAWLRRVFIPSLADHVRTVFVGRDRPATAWLVSPGWEGLVGTLALGPLDEAEAAEMLVRSGADREATAQINSFARGHPLALKLAATVTMDRSGSHGARASKGLHRVVEELTRLYLADVRDPVTKRALEAASVVRRTTLSLLQAMTAEAAVQSGFEQLRSLPFVEAERDGLRLHDLVQQSISSSLRAEDPNRYQEYRRAAWRQLRTEAMKTGLHDLWRYTADLLYLIENPIVREAFFPAAAQEYSVEPFRPEDGPAVRAIARRHDPRAAADVIQLWIEKMPEAFYVARDQEGMVAGFYHMFESKADAVALVDDPVVQQWLLHLRDNPAEGRALFLRRWLSRDDGERPSAVQAACWLDIKRTYMEMRPDLRRVYLVLNDLARYAPVAQRLCFRPVGECVDLGGAGYQSAVLDFGPQSVDGWLATLAARELGVEEDFLGDDFIDEGAHEVIVAGARVKLTKLEFDLFLYLYRRKGRVVTRAALIEEVWGQKQSGSNVVEAVVRSLRKKLGIGASAIETIRGSGYRYRAS